MSAGNVYIDGWTNSDFQLKSEIIDDINRREYSNVKTEKAIKHFVDIFTKSKKTKKELKEYMSPRGNYLNTGKEAFNTRLVFLDKTIRNVQMSTSDDPTLTKCPVAFIPEGKTARCRYDWHDVFVRFRVAGTLIIYHRIDTNDRWQSDYAHDIFGLRRLDAGYEHNIVIIQIDFDSYPDLKNPNSKRKIVIDADSRRIDNLIIQSDDRFLEDVNHLKQLVDLQNIDNVKNIEWEFNEEL